MKINLFCLAILLGFVWVLALADDGPHEPRILGNTAVMHVYYYAPKTLEVTYVDSYLFKDEAACEEAIAKAGMISTPLASEGDLVEISCIVVHPPRHEPAVPPPVKNETST